MKSSPKKSILKVILEKNKKREETQISVTNKYEWKGNDRRKHQIWNQITLHLSPDSHLQRALRGIIPCSCQRKKNVPGGVEGAKKTLFKMIQQETRASGKLMEDFGGRLVNIMRPSVYCYLMFLEVRVLPSHRDWEIGLNLDETDIPEQ